MRLVDAYCGTGGWSAGAVAAGCTPILGIDCDEKPLQLWAANCAPYGGRAACATIGTDEAVDWPEAEPDLHVHLSPPCTSLSKARSASAASVAAALESVRRCVQLVLERGHASWALENVATPAVVACVRELAQRHPARVAFVVLDAANYGCSSNRVRLIASTPEVIKKVKEQPVRRVSVADAFAAAELPLPAEFLKSNTTNRDGSAAVRSVQQPAFTVTASHPLMWCTRDAVRRSAASPSPRVRCSWASRLAGGCRRARGSACAPWATPSRRRSRRRSWPAPGARPPSRRPQTARAAAGARAARART